ncbi:MAG: ABC transporter permease [Candidatus Binatia bacterium]
MLIYTLRRLALLVPTVVGVVTVVFFLIHLIPGDPVEVMLGESATPADRVELRRALDLDRPLGSQYLSFLAATARADLGRSIHSGQPVTRVIADRLPATIRLTIVAMVIAMFIALPFGLLSAWKPGSSIDRASLLTAMLGVAIPNFWLGPMLILLFSIELGWLPVSGSSTPLHLLLPAITLGTAMAGLLARLTRSTVLEALHEDYVRTARAKGLSEASVVARHALANALTPLLSVLGLQFGGLLAGSIITETIFAWPGIGRLVVQAIHTRDYPVVQGCVLIIALSYVIVNLATDLAYALVNPRVRYGNGDG